jgi:polysaccharide export outer membrane protein
MARSSYFRAMALLICSIVAHGQGAPSATSAAGDNAAFQLGPGDVIQITAVDAEEISKGPVRISSDGYINLPTLGRLKAADRTLEELQSDIADRLKRLIVDPDVSVTVLESHSQPVSVLGAV